MAQDTSRPGSQQRRGSLARRALKRMRAAMLSRSRSARDEEATASTSRIATVPEQQISVTERDVEATNTITSTEVETETRSTAAEPEDQDEVLPASIPAAPVATINTMEADSSDEDTGEPEMPARMGRSGLTTEKARALFEQHGFNYALRTWQPLEERPHKIRRVEKPIRMRVHYTCHECTRQFGVDRTCMECGHHRCQDCPRNPPRKPRQVSDNARSSAPEGRASPVAGPSTAVPVEESASRSVPSPLDMLHAPLELDDEDAEDTPGNNDFSFFTRPRAAVQTPRAAAGPRSRSQKQPQREPIQQNPGQMPPAPVVQRVFRKPRQRVRYTCDQCAALFTNHDQCRQCGHERCDDCIRQPPKRTPVQPDPEVLRSLADRLAGHGEPSSSRAPET